MLCVYNILNLIVLFSFFFFWQDYFGCLDFEMKRIKFNKAWAFFKDEVMTREVVYETRSLINKVQGHKCR